MRAKKLEANLDRRNYGGTNNDCNHGCVVRGCDLYQTGSLMSKVQVKKKEVSMDSDARFDRMEAKLDKMVEALAKLIVVETKIDHINEQQDTQNKRLDAHSDRLDKLNTAAIKASGASSDKR